MLFFFNDTATTEIYTLSLHDALPISTPSLAATRGARSFPVALAVNTMARYPPCFARSASACAHASGAYRVSCHRDRKSTRLNSSHGYISYAVFCLKKKKKQAEPYIRH